MPSASWALQKAIHVALTQSAAVTALVGGVRIYDDVPRDAAFPYVTHGQSVVRDWSTATDDAHEHLVTLHVWTRGAGRKQAHEILGAVERALDQQALALDGHALVTQRHEFSEIRRGDDGETWHGLLRLRAVTEPTA
jgi:hypothetical protein